MERAHDRPMDAMRSADRAAARAGQASADRSRRGTAAGCTGAAVERYFRERDGGLMPRAAVVHPGDLSRFDNVQSALAVGEHAGNARPLELPISRLPDLLDLLGRPVEVMALPGIGDRIETTVDLRHEVMSARVLEARIERGAELLARLELKVFLIDEPA